MCLAAVFVENRAYQENELVAEHHRQGHEVLVIANTETHDDKGQRAFSEPGHYRTKEGVSVVRISYHPLLPQSVGKSLRLHHGLYAMINDFGPDFIMFHGISSGSLLQVARYAKRHPEVQFYADNHADFVNSARSFLSRWGLHYLYYRPILHRALPFIRKVFGVSLLTLEFARDMYGVPESKLEFYPLGGHPVHEPEYTRRRNETRARLGLTSDNILFVQSGKQSRIKKLPELLRAFTKVSNPRMIFLVAGLLMDEIRDEVEAIARTDSRIQFLGWLDPSELEDYLCAADIYAQPGSQSSTMQTSLCCHCPVLLQDWESHHAYVDNNGWLVAGEKDLLDIIRNISEGKSDLTQMGARSFAIATDMLDYRVLAAKVLK
jgi:1,2-diacylglycerol 3-alpha-glucosyltransferase